MDSLHNKNTEGIDTSWCKTHDYILCWPIREKELRSQYSDQYIDDKIWHLIFPHQLYEITGKELNDIAKLHYITFTTCFCYNREYEYIFKYGENVDTKEFSPHGKCSMGEFYFTLERMIENYCNFGDIIFEISIDDDARVWIEDRKMKTNKINIVSIIKHINFDWKSLYFDTSYCRIRKKKLCAQIRDDNSWKNIFPHIHIEITGYDLNKIGRHYGVTFAKRITFLQNNECKFNCGKNVAKEFCPRGPNIPGGIYFTLECLTKKWNTIGETIVEVTVDDDARVWIEDWKMKADKINIVGAIYENNS